MIDLTPLDVRSKRGDFKKLMRGYDPQEVDVFLELVAERLEALTRESIALKERSQTLEQQVASQADREHAVQEALVTAQELRADMREQAKKEAEHILKEAETEGRRLVAEAEAEARTRARALERRVEQLEDALRDLERRRERFLKDFRLLLERELDVVDVEERRVPMEERTIDLELGSRRGGEAPGQGEPPAQVEAPVQGEAPREAASAVPAPPAVPPGSALEAPPPPDASVDELAAAYEAAQASEEAPAQGRDPSQPPRTGSASDNLLLYLDPEEEA